VEETDGAVTELFYLVDEDGSWAPLFSKNRGPRENQALSSESGEEDIEGSGLEVKEDVESEEEDDDEDEGGEDKAEEYYPEANWVPLHFPTVKKGASMEGCGWSLLKISKWNSLHVETARVDGFGKVVQRVWINPIRGKSHKLVTITRKNGCRIIHPFGTERPGVKFPDADICRQQEFLRHRVPDGFGGTFEEFFVVDESGVKTHLTTKHRCVVEKVWRWAVKRPKNKDPAESLRTRDSAKKHNNLQNDGGIATNEVINVGSEVTAGENESSNNQMEESRRPISTKRRSAISKALRSLVGNRK